jgi:hypothetical protein
MHNNQGAKIQNIAYVVAHHADVWKEKAQTPLISIFFVLLQLEKNNHFY